MADATSLNLDAHGSNAWLWDFAFNEFEGATRMSDLHGAHLRHNSSDSYVSF
ncbi:MAG: hypothetical protein ACREI9_08285 [Nitrospiraceae bacterium]